MDANAAIAMERQTAGPDWYLEIAPASTQVPTPRVAPTPGGQEGYVEQSQSCKKTIYVRYPYFQVNKYGTRTGVAELCVFRQG